MRAAEEPQAPAAPIQNGGPESAAEASVFPLTLHLRRLCALPRTKRPKKCRHQRRPRQPLQGGRVPTRPTPTGLQWRRARARRGGGGAAPTGRATERWTRSSRRRCGRLLCWDGETRGGRVGLEGASQGKGPAARGQRVWLAGPPDQSAATARSSPPHRCRCASRACGTSLLSPRPAPVVLLAAAHPPTRPNTHPPSPKPTNPHTRPLHAPLSKSRRRC